MTFATLFLDGSSGKMPDGDMIRFGVGGFFGWEHPSNFGSPANLKCSSMYECEMEQSCKKSLSFGPLLSHFT